MCITVCRFCATQCCDRTHTVHILWLTPSVLWKESVIVDDEICFEAWFPELVYLRVPPIAVPDMTGGLQRTPKDWISGKFLRAPIPLDWLGKACNLPGKCLVTALALWFLYGVSNKKNDL